MITAITIMIVSILNVHDKNLFHGQMKQHSEHIIAPFVLALAIGTCQCLVIFRNFDLDSRWSEWSQDSSLPLGEFSVNLIMAISSVNIKKNLHRNYSQFSDNNDEQGQGWQKPSLQWRDLFSSKFSSGRPSAPDQYHILHLFFSTLVEAFVCFECVPHCS